MELLSIIIPIYNERSTLAACLKRVLDVELSIPREVILVNDGSTDNSEVIAKKFAEANECVRLINAPRNRGKGAAVALGLQDAKGSIAVVQDADLEYNPQDLPKLLKPILEGRADAVYGSRFASGPERRVLYYRHSLGNRAVTFCSNLLTDLNLTDVETCYKAFRLSIIDGIKIRSRSFTFEIEITAKLAHLGARIYEVPISYHGRSYLEGKKITWRDGVKALFAAVRFWMSSDLGASHIINRAKVQMHKLRRYNKWIAKKVLPRVSNSVVEYGSDLGQLSNHLTSAEELTLIEPNAECAEYLKNRFSHRPNVKVVTGEPEENQFIKADTVVVTSALAQKSTELLTLKTLASYLKPDGEMVLFLPNIEMLFSPLDESREYRARYSKKAVREMLLSAGLQTKSIKTMNRVGSVFWFIAGKILRRKKLGGWLLGVYDFFTPLWKLLDYILPISGLNMVVRAKLKQA